MLRASRLYDFFTLSRDEFIWTALGRRPADWPGASEDDWMIFRWKTSSPSSPSAAVSPKTQSNQVVSQTSSSSSANIPAPPEFKPPSSRYLEIGLAVAGIAASIYGSYIGLGSSDRWILLLFGLSLVATVISLFVIIAQNRMIWAAYNVRSSLERRIYDLQRTRDILQGEFSNVRSSLEQMTKQITSAQQEKESAVQDARLDVHAVYAQIAQRFHYIALSISAFEHSVFHYLGTLASGDINVGKAREDRRKIDDLLNNLLADICSTASFVIAARKPEKGPNFCSANIKVLIGGPNHRYFTYVRGGQAPGLPNRKLRDDALRDEPLFVRENKIYEYLKNKKTDPKFYVCDNIDDVLEEIKRDNTPTRRYSKPDQRDKLDYVSFITVPIIGRGDEHGGNYLKDGRAYAKAGEIHVLGYFCVDSQKLRFFDKEYDVNIMQQLATVIFDCFRAFDAVYKITAQMGLDQYFGGTVRFRTRMVRQTD